MAEVAQNNRSVNAVELVNQESPAGKDGTIQPGDLLLSVGDHNVETAEVRARYTVL
jgi:hypothetical protein